MDLEEESDVAGFLGVLVERCPDGSLKLLQTGLIQRIISALEIDHLPPKRTPAKLGVLGKDANGEEPNGVYSYASVIGMLGYLHAIQDPILPLLLLNARGSLMELSAVMSKLLNELDNI